MSFKDPRVLAPVPEGDVTAMRAALTKVAGFIDDPIADVRFSPEDDDSSPRSVTIQVRDRLNKPWAGRWVLFLSFSTTQWGSDATQTVAISGAASVTEIASNAAYIVVTESDGSCLAEIGGISAEYYITASVIGRAQLSPAVELS